MSQQDFFIYFWNMSCIPMMISVSRVQYNSFNQEIQ